MRIKKIEAQGSVVINPYEGGCGQAEQNQTDVTKSVVTYSQRGRTRSSRLKSGRVAMTSTPQVWANLKEAHKIRRRIRAISIERDSIRV